MFKHTKTDEEHEQMLELTKKLQDPAFLTQFLDEVDQAQAAKKTQPTPQTQQQPTQEQQQQKKKHWWQ